MKYRVKSIMVMVGILLISKGGAQTPPPPNNSPGTNGSGVYANGFPVGESSPSVPFDGGMSLILLATGIKYGAKKLR